MYIYVEQDSIFFTGGFYGMALGIVGGCLIVIALLAVYVPTIYIRKTDKILTLLEKIEANTRK